MTMYWDGEIRPRDERGRFVKKQAHVPAPDLHDVIDSEYQDIINLLAADDMLDGVELADAAALAALRVEVSLEGAAALSHPDKETALNLALGVCIKHSRRYAELMDLTGQPL